MLATLVVGSLTVPEKFNLIIFSGGLIGALTCYFIAYVFEGKEEI